ncbi:MAG: hypothetical protein K8R88_10965 [Armatimonadetes bacterium]|nr:hypothetical protein [Armatimonadota bacterium]
MQSGEWTRLGLVLLGTPLVAFMILVFATGDAIKGKVAKLFFGAVYSLYWSGRFLFPLGVMCLIKGAIVV